MEKPRERALKHGISSLNDSELIAILLRTGRKGKNVVEVADDVLEEFGNSFLRMQKASVKELSKIKGLGQAKSLTVQAALEMGKRMWRETLKERKPLKTSEDVYELCKDMILLDVEVVRVMILDSQLGLIASRDITVGTATTSLVHPREIFAAAVVYPSSGIILAHNHPSGSLTPSVEDKRITKRMKDASEIMGIKLIDHLIVASKGYYSFAKDGKL